jgi:tetratricopeptide (TPR) repeat protein
VALCWGLLAGLVLFVPAGYYYRFWRESSAIRGGLDFTEASVGDVNANWRLWQRVQRQNAFLGGLSPAGTLAPNVRSALLHAGDEVIERYRNSSDPEIRDFDWAKAAACFEHARELDEHDRTVRGKLALAKGYVALSGARAQAAQAEFSQAVPLLPQSPDPHLGLARVYVYSVKNVGKAIAELHEAERLGFEAGPREAEEQGDGYRMRAAAELNEARREAASNRVIEERYLRLARRDFERARELYEPIQGFSNVSVALREMDEEDRARQQLEEALTVKLAKRQRKPGHRSSRWP